MKATETGDKTLSEDQLFLLFAFINNDLYACLTLPHVATINMLLCLLMLLLVCGFAHASEYRPPLLPLLPLPTGVLAFALSSSCASLATSALRCCA